MTHSKRTSILLRAALLAGSALPAAAQGAPTANTLSSLDLSLLDSTAPTSSTDPTRTIQPYYGNINAFYGNITSPSARRLSAGPATSR